MTEIAPGTGDLAPIQTGANTGIVFNFPDLYDGWGPPVNDALELIDTLLFLTVVEMDLSAPPANPVSGQCWIVAANPTGAWAGEANSIALWSRGVWRFFIPRPGWRTFNLQTNIFYTFLAGEWSVANLTLQDVATTVESLQTQVQLVNQTYGSVATAAASATEAAASVVLATETAQAIQGLQTAIQGSAAQAVAAATAADLSNRDLQAVTQIAQADINGLAQSVLQMAFNVKDARSYFDLLTHQAGVPVFTVIQQNQTQQINGDSALAAIISLIGAQNAEGSGFIFDEDTVYVTPTQSLAAKFQEIDSQFSTSDANFQTEVDALTGINNALATEISKLGALTADGSAFDLNVDTVNISSTESLGQKLTDIATQFGLFQTQITGNETTDSTSTSAAAATIATLGVTSNNGTAFQLNMNTVYVDDNETIGTRLSTIDATFGSYGTNLSTEETNRATGDSAIADVISQIGVVGPNGSGFYLNHATVYIDATQTIDQLTTSLQTSIGSNTGSITGINLEVATLSQVYGTYGVTLNEDGTIAGMTLFASGGAQNVSLAAFDVQSFYIKATGYPQVSPFFYDGTTGTLYLQNLMVNGNTILNGTLSGSALSAFAVTGSALFNSPSGTTYALGNINSTPVQIISGVYPAHGATIALFVYVEVANTNQNNDQQIQITAFRDGTQIDYYTGDVRQNSSSLSGGYKVQLEGMVPDTGASGSFAAPVNHTYSVDAQLIGGINGGTTVTRARLFLLEFKDQHK